MKLCVTCGGGMGSRGGKVCLKCYNYRWRTGRERPNSFGDLRLISDGGVSRLGKGEQNRFWKGDAASKAAKRQRAVRQYALGQCERCERPAVDRHHVDGDTGNNGPENIARLCRRCHEAADGRLARLPEMGRTLGAAARRAQAQARKSPGGEAEA